MKIDDFVGKLSKAFEALESAPQKGFINLDEVKATIDQTRRFMEKIRPSYEFGERLTQDCRESMLAKLKVLKIAGAGTLFSQAEKTLMTDDLDFDQWKTLQVEIDESLKHAFGSQTKQPASVNNSKYNLPRKPDDYR
ncbi:MAG: hypothetical protein GY839_11640 [candidate division Zixibacteria bacterium]|nr:hypothetical protein [candidate division Zixibacteria bacterium]